MSTGEHAERFTHLRPLLFTIVYEILGSATESDDVLQERYLRWADVDLSGVRDTKSYLAQLVTRQALNALRAGARRREDDIGPWLPEPLLLDDRDASADVVLAESVSMAMLVLLETLSPDEQDHQFLRHPQSGKAGHDLRPEDDPPLAFCHAGSVRIERLGDLGTAPEVLRAIAAAATRYGLPPPAALIGDWFGSGAVIAPSVAVVPVGASEVFAVPPGASSGAVGGGWFGYLSYPDDGADEQPPRLPEAAGGWSDCVLRQDSDGHWWYESLSGATCSTWVIEALHSAPAPGRCDVAWSEADRDAHRRGVLECLEAIAAGEVYQACVCTQFAGRFETGPAPAATSGTAPVDFFVDAVARTSPARAAYLAGPWGAVASLSPELFLRRCGEAVTSSPIKGTLPRSADRSLLRASVKDVAENIMIVDLVRNDLGRVAITGSVTVPELLAVRPAPGVWHLVSTVSARIGVDVPMSVVLDATFPPASVTGTPKTRARQLLSVWEPKRRGIYCGTIGLASPLAGCELNVAIRTVEFGVDGSAVLGVGGGITADSDPDREWEECLDKAAPIVGSPIPRPQDGVVQVTP